MEITSLGLQPDSSSCHVACERKLQQEPDSIREGKLQSHQHWEPPAAPAASYTVFTWLSICAGGLLPPASCTASSQASVFPSFSFSLHFPSFSISASFLLRTPPTPSPPQAPVPACWLLRPRRRLPPPCRC